MDDESNAKAGFARMVMGIIFLVLAGTSGGTFRTAATYTPPGVAPSKGDTVIEEAITVQHWFLGLVPGNGLDVQTLIDRHKQSGKRVTQVSVMTKHTVADLLLTAVTFGVYAPDTVVLQVRLRPEDALAANNALSQP